MDELIERLRERAEFEDKRVLDEAKAMGFDPEVYTGSQTGALLREAAAALEAAREDGWQPVETAPKPDIGTNGFGKRLLLVVDCGGGTIPSVRKGYWEGTDWYLDCCIGLATACGYRVTHWRPLPAPPAIERARGEAGGEVA